MTAVPQAAPTTSHRAHAEAPSVLVTAVVDGSAGSVASLVASLRTAARLGATLHVRPSSSLAPSDREAVTTDALVAALRQVPDPPRLRCDVGRATDDDVPGGQRAHDLPVQRCAGQIPFSW